MPPLVIAYHLILTAYGFWLPNDPRGSWSDFVRVWELFCFGGPATKTSERRSLAREPHDIQKRLALKNHLVRPAVEFNGLQAQTIGSGFTDYRRRTGVIIYACSILPKHVHLVIARHTCSIEQVARRLKQAATTALLEANLHPFQSERYADRRCPSPWTRKEWSVFLDCEADIVRASDYTDRNPECEGKPRQNWSFVTPYVA
jgi:REP element-mobilizing transposase RayT